MTGRRCGRWRPAVPSKHDGLRRVVCTLPLEEHRGWHVNEPSGWMWQAYGPFAWPSMRPTWVGPLERDWRCNGAGPEDRTRHGVVFRGTEEQARVKGWRIGRRDGTWDPLCPDCGRPDPGTLRLVRDLERSLR